MIFSDTYSVKQSGDEWLVTKNGLKFESYDTKAEADAAADLAVKRSHDRGRKAERK